MFFPSGILGNPTLSHDDTSPDAPHFTGGILFTVTEETVITGIRWYSTADIAGGSVYGELILNSSDGILTGSAAAITTVEGWNSLPFPEPYTLAAGTVYRAVVHQADTAAYTYMTGALPVSDAPFAASGGGFSYGEFPNAGLTPTASWFGVDVVTDSGDDTPVAVTVSAAASASSVEAGTVVTLTATPHYGDGSPTYAWVQTSGPTVALDSTTAAVVHFTPTDTGSHAFTVTATDTTGTASADVAVTVTAPDDGGDDGDDSGDGGTAGVLWVNISAPGDPANWVPVGSGGTYEPVDPPYVFRPESYGAIGDGTHDDTAAINAAVAAALAAAPDNNHIGEVRFQAKTYLLSGALVRDTTNYTNAQIPLPAYRSGNPKVTLRLQGVGNGAPYSHWNQTHPALTGTVLRSTLTGQGYHGTYGAPSIIGGPSDVWVDPDNGNDGLTWANFSNMLLYVDGITFSAPANPTLACVNALKLATLDIGEVSCIANVPVIGDPTLKTMPTADGYGIVFPKVGNNVRAQARAITVEGFGTAVLASEHVTIADLGAVYCNIGLQVAPGLPGSGVPTHGIHVQHACMEAVNTLIACIEGMPIPLVIGLIDAEGIDGTVHVSDTGNSLRGQVVIADIFKDTLTINGGSHLTVTNLFA